MWESVLASLIANLIYTAFVAASAIAITLIVLGRTRRRLFELLCINTELPRVQIYVSRLDVRRGGSRGTDGRLSVGFTGPALMQLEYSGALAIEKVLREPFVEVLPRFIRRLIVRRVGHLSEVPVSIDVGPDEKSCQPLLEYGTDTIVLLGSDVYSYAVRSIYRSSNSFIGFVSETLGCDYDASDRQHGEPAFAVREEGLWHPIPARSIGREVGTIQRVTLKSGRRVVMCAGISSSTTCASAHYLCNHWLLLSARFGSDDFLVVLGFAEQSADALGLREAEELPDYEKRRAYIPDTTRNRLRRTAKTSSTK